MTNFLCPSTGAVMHKLAIQAIIILTLSRCGSAWGDEGAGHYKALNAAVEIMEQQVTVAEQNCVSCWAAPASLFFSTESCTKCKEAQDALTKVHDSSSFAQAFQFFRTNSVDAEFWHVEALMRRGLAALDRMNALYDKRDVLQGTNR